MSPTGFCPISIKRHQEKSWIMFENKRSPQNEPRKWIKTGTLFRRETCSTKSHTPVQAKDDEKKKLHRTHAFS